MQAVDKGNFTSRLSHSCDPNCKTMPVVAGGRLTIGERGWLGRVALFPTAALLPLLPPGQSFGEGMQ